MGASSYNGTTLPVDAKLDILHDMRMSAFERVFAILRASLARRIKKYTSLTRQSYGVMSASECRFCGRRGCPFDGAYAAQTIGLTPSTCSGRKERLERVHLRSRRALKRCLRCSLWPTGRASYYESSRQKVRTLRLFLVELRDQ